MIIHSLSLFDFRKFKHFEVECHPKMNCFFGLNGTGKTTLLEAIWTLVASSSFRTHKSTHLIQDAKKEAKISIHYEINEILQSLSLSIQGSKREATHNQSKLALSNLIGILLAVVISTEDMELIEGDPSHRRYFLDLMLSQLDPLYLWHLKRWNKGLKHKNQLLKLKSFKSIPFFEEEMAKSAAYISEKRVLLIEELRLLAVPLLKEISGKESTISMEYKKWTKEELQKRWDQEKEQERKVGYTLSGPHRDDIKISLNQKEAKVYASMGEKKSLVIALKLSQHQLIRQLSSHTPILLIDDYASHLDLSRQENFLNILRFEGQVFLTNPTPLPFIQNGQFLTLE